MTYSVDERPHQSSTPNCPFVVLKDGAPLIWWSTEGAASTFAAARNDGIPINQAIALARNS